MNKQIIILPLVYLSSLLTFDSARSSTQEPSEFGICESTGSVTKIYKLEDFNPKAFYWKPQSIEVVENHGTLQTLSQIEVHENQNDLILEAPLEEEAQQIAGVEEKVLNPDNDRRKPIENPKKLWPHRVSGRLHMRFKDKTGKMYSGPGTGVLVGPCHILTAGHNLFDKNYGWAQSVEFYPAGQSKSCVHGKLYLCTTHWVETGREDFDFGMVILDQPLGLKIGWLGMTCGPEEVLEDKEVTVVGYPRDKQAKHVDSEGNERVTSWTMWGMTGSIKRVEAEQIYYDIDTEKGTSGAGVWTTLEGAETLFGIHTYSGSEYNKATRLAQEKFNHIVDWIRSFSYVGNELEKAITLLTENTCDHLELSLNLMVEDSGKRFFNALQQNTSLQRLNLSGASFRAEQLKKALKAHPNLTRLDLSRTGMTDVGVTHLCAALKKQKKLQFLNLSYNRITDEILDSLPGVINKNSLLLKIDLSDNQMTSSCLRNITNCLEKNIEQYLKNELDCVEIDHAGIRSFFKVLQRTKKNIVWELPPKPEQISRENALELLKHFAISRDYRELVFSRGLTIIYLEDIGLRLLLSILRINETIQTLHIDDNMLTDSGLKELATVIQFCPQLRYLNIQNNNISSEGVQRFKRQVPESLLVAVSGNGRKFEHEYVRLEKGRHFQFEQKCIKKRLKERGSLTEGLLVKGLKIPDLNDEFDLLNIDRLSTLGFEGKSVEIPALRDFFTYMPRSSTLKTLSVHSVYMTSPVLEALAQVLGDLRLERLNLMLCGLSAERACILSLGLKECHFLTELNLDSNFLGDGIESICQALQSSKNLHTISLSRNFIKRGQAQPLLELLEQHPSLKKIDLNYNFFDKQSLQKFKRISNKDISIALENSTFKKAFYIPKAWYQGIFEGNMYDSREVLNIFLEKEMRGENIVSKLLVYLDIGAEQNQMREDQPRLELLRAITLMLASERETIITFSHEILEQDLLNPKLPLVMQLLTEITDPLRVQAADSIQSFIKSADTDYLRFYLQLAKSLPSSDFFKFLKNPFVILPADQSGSEEDAVAYVSHLEKLDPEQRWGAIQDSLPLVNGMSLQERALMLETIVAIPSQDRQSEIERVQKRYLDSLGPEIAATGKAMVFKWITQYEEAFEKALPYFTEGVNSEQQTALIGVILELSPKTCDQVIKLALSLFSEDQTAGAKIFRLIDSIPIGLQEPFVNNVVQFKGEFSITDLEVAHVLNALSVNQTLEQLEDVLKWSRQLFHARMSGLGLSKVLSAMQTIPQDRRRDAVVYTKQLLIKNADGTTVANILSTTNELDSTLFPRVLHIATSFEIHKMNLTSQIKLLQIIVITYVRMKHADALFEKILNFFKELSFYYNSPIEYEFVLETINKLADFAENDSDFTDDISVKFKYEIMSSITFLFQNFDSTREDFYYIPKLVSLFMKSPKYSPIRAVAKLGTLEGGLGKAMYQLEELLEEKNYRHNDLERHYSTVDFYDPKDSHRSFYWDGSQSSFKDQESDSYTSTTDSGEF